MGKRNRKRQREAPPQPVAGPIVDPRRDHQLKLARAREHLEKLNGEIRAFLDAAEKTTVEEPDPERPGHYGAWVTAYNPPRDPFSILIGDALQGLRSTLDHVAFELAAAFTVPLPDDLAKASEFPIFSASYGRERFHQRRSRGSQTGEPAPGSGLAKTAGMDPAAQEIIERLQPYQRGDEYTTDPLWRLHELNRIDKHRLLHVAVMSLEGAMLDLSKTVNVAALNPPGIQSFGAILNGRTQVARWVPVPIDPNKKMRTGFGGAITFAFAPDTPVVGEAPVSTTLVDIYNYVIEDVLPPLRGFLE